jgi:hypothetical protein
MEAERSAERMRSAENDNAILPQSMQHDSLVAIPVLITAMASTLERNLFVIHWYHCHCPVFLGYYCARQTNKYV